MAGILHDWVEVVVVVAAVEGRITSITPRGINFAIGKARVFGSWMGQGEVLARRDRCR